MPAIDKIPRRPVQKRSLFQSRDILSLVSLANKIDCKDRESFGALEIRKKAFNFFSENEVIVMELKNVLKGITDLCVQLI
jgi:hypothetical protein